MDQNCELLIGALARSIAGKAYALPENVDWERVMCLAQAHDICPLFCDGLRKVPEYWQQVPEQIRQKLQQKYMKAIYWDAQRDYIRDQLKQRLTQEQVPHVFLKGICLKELYPEPALRTMSDIDALVYTRDYGKIGNIAADLGGVPCESDGNHNNFRFKNGVLVEFHPNLLHHSAFVGAQMNPGWQYVKQNGESSAMEMTEEGLYLNVLCHLAHHFVCGGVGVRFVMDVWVCRNLWKSQPDRVKVEQELAQMGLLEFARNIEALAECWFGSESMTEKLEELGEYILTSGTHGTSDRAILNAVTLAPGGSPVAALWKKAFYPKGELEDRFPWCKGKPMLLPAAWFARAWGAVTKRGNLIQEWGKGVGSVGREEARQQRELLRRFGIRIPE